MTHAQLAALGFATMPVVYRSKQPMLAWKQWQYTRPSAELLQRWDDWSTPLNVGIITGQVSGIVVVDCDTELQQRWVDDNLPGTPWVVITAHGSHHYYRWTRDVRNARTRCFDIRGDGGYVVAPGSTHEEGVPYTPVTGPWRPTDEVPEFDPMWLLWAMTRQ